MNFTELNLHEDLLKGITDTGFITLMPVQEETLVHTLLGRDAYVQSQTGTGKTAAFLVTIFQLFLDEKNQKKRKKALIITPTRELAVQIDNDAQLLGKYLNFKVGCFYGGVGYDVQEKLLELGVDIIIGTPGRLIDFHQKKKIDFSNVGILVIDEADRLFDMGFLPDIRKIVDSMPRRIKRLTMLFSATMDARTKAITREYMKNPAMIEIMPEQMTVERVTQKLYHVSEKEKISLMLGVLKKENPKNVLIFTNMKHTASMVARKLEHNGYKAQYISGDLPQTKRLRVIDSFKDGKLPILVATDVAARGLHIEDLELIINYDLPQDPESYVHRIGRTARAGKSGKAISLVCENFVYSLDAIESFIGMKIPVADLEDALFHEDKAEGINMEKPEKRKPTSHPRERRNEKRNDEKNKTRNNERPSAKSGAKRYEKRSDKLTEKHIEKPKDSQHDKNRTMDREPRKDKQNAAKRTPASSPKKEKNFSPKGKFDKQRSYDRKQTGKPDNDKQKSKSLEDRLEYYKKKYGDNFTVNGNSKTPETKSKTVEKEAANNSKPSLIKRILGIFKRN